MENAPSDNKEENESKKMSDQMIDKGLETFKWDFFSLFYLTLY